MMEQLNLKPGKWLIADCGSMPSESNCQLVMLAPEDQKEDLIEAGSAHAIHKHGHQDSSELRDGIRGMIQVTEIN